MTQNDRVRTNSLRVLLRAQVLYVFQGRVTLSRELFMVAFTDDKGDIQVSDRGFSLENHPFHTQNERQ